jgi:hypothetical protein
MTESHKNEKMLKEILQREKQTKKKGSCTFFISLSLVSILVLVAAVGVMVQMSHLKPNTFALKPLPTTTPTIELLGVTALSPAGDLPGAVAFTFRPNADGEITGTDAYTGLHDGRIVKVDLRTGATTEVFNTNKDLRLQPPYKCGDYYLEHLCGFPMAMQFDKEGYRLIVLDAYKGLLSVNLEENKFTYLSREVDGKSYKFLHSMAISKSTGKIYFTEASDTFYRRDYMSEILEARGKGRLLVFNPADLSTTVLATKLRFPSGLVIREQHHT